MSATLAFNASILFFIALDILTRFLRTTSGEAGVSNGALPAMASPKPAAVSGKAGPLVISSGREPKISSNVDVGPLAGSGASFGNSFSGTKSSGSGW